jgi:hypothetical protein
MHMKSREGSITICIQLVYDLWLLLKLLNNDLVIVEVMCLRIWKVGMNFEGGEYSLFGVN